MYLPAWCAAGFAYAQNTRQFIEAKAEGTTNEPNPMRILAVTAGRARPRQHANALIVPSGIGAARQFHKLPGSQIALPSPGIGSHTPRIVSRVEPVPGSSSFFRLTGA